MSQDIRTWRARAGEVHDGDTPRMTMDTGFDTTCRKWLRLRDVRAPELKQYGGPEADLFVERWLEVHADPAAHWPFVVTTWRTSGDNDVTTLERYIAEVRDLDGNSLNDAVRALLAEHPDWPGGR